MKKRILYCLLPIVTLILELLPCGAVCTFSNPTGAPWRKTFSYFSLIPFGYANVAPLLTALVTCGVLLLLAVYLFTGSRRVLTGTAVTLGVGTVLSLGPLYFGWHNFSAVGGLITLTLLAELCLLLLAARPRTPAAE